MDLLLQSWSIQGITASKTIQTKKRNYLDWHLANQFLPLMIEIFSYLCKEANDFLHDCANVVWSLRRPKGAALFLLLFFTKSIHNIKK
jgi:hypothetical protein